ncbi:hypothetical protein M422DRAFT_264373 [Sphaerobolus stellatus SS14]|uniref:Unplaced genomic scaffold SPHSTscaffold_135, whole genome shotgun sequence n=1 Tax=Sphaerobolus stellatus (strain SS14) TaxID=990650 RepID=A0A0C9UWG2_SPHS4|nr:hypothetical protein M422DRAFT_264373 [Sphaerobolus stellatus SS14]
MSPSTQRPNQPSIRVIYLGLSRTGTVSLMEALELLEYGPYYHTIKWVQSQPNDFHKWIEQYETANFPEALYRVCPDAKFILTTRDPENGNEA